MQPSREAAFLRQASCSYTKKIKINFFYSQIIFYFSRDIQNQIYLHQINFSYFLSRTSYFNFCSMTLLSGVAFTPYSYQFSISMIRLGEDLPPSTYVTLLQSPVPAIRFVVTADMHLCPVLPVHGLRTFSTRPRRLSRTIRFMRVCHRSLPSPSSAAMLKYTTEFGLSAMTLNYITSSGTSATLSKYSVRLSCPRQR